MDPTPTAPDGVCALLMVNAEPGAWHALKSKLAAIPGVDWVALCTGQVDFVLRARVASLADLRALVLDELQAMPQIRNTQTVLVLDEA